MGGLGPLVDKVDGDWRLRSSRGWLGVAAAAAGEGLHVGLVLLGLAVPGPELGGVGAAW